MLLALLLTLASVAGCTSAGTPAGSGSAAPGSQAASGGGASPAGETVGGAAPAGGVTYPVDTDITLTLALTTEAPVTANFQTLSETPFAQNMAERTGIDIEYQYLLDDNAFSVMFASGDLPDLVHFDFSQKYSGGMEKAIADQIVLPLTDYIEAYAPDYYAVLQGNDYWRKSVMTTQGDYTGAPMFIDSENDKILTVTNGAIFRMDWLEELNMELPETVTELYDVLKAFKDQKGVQVPFSHRDPFANAYFFGPWGIPNNEWYQIDGTVGFGYYNPQVREVFRFMNKLYAEGLMDPNFVTLDDDTLRSNIMNGVSGMTFGTLSGSIGTFLETVRPTDPTYTVTGGPYIVADENKGSVPISGQYKRPVSTVMACITSACENPEIATQWLNYGYTDEGHMAYNFGIEGESYTMENGEPVYTDLLLNNPEGMTMQYAMAMYTRSWASGPFQQDTDYMVQYNLRMPEQMTAVTNWSNTDAYNKYLYGTTVATADSTEFANIMGEAKTLYDEMKIKFVTGEANLEGDFDAYLETLKSMKIERAIEIQQNALDEFTAR
jgi:putative aldouronate transport system substrate-binding protein